MPLECCDDKCTLVPSSWCRYIIALNGELAIQFYDRTGKRPDACCLYPGTPCMWYITAQTWPSKGKFVHAFLYKRRPYRLIRSPCPLATFVCDTGLNTAHGSTNFILDGTWTAPAGVIRVRAELYGAGAGGAQRNLATGANGGGGGAYVKSCITVVPGNNYAVVVGVAGIGGTLGGNGTSGTNTTFGGAVAAGGNLNGLGGAVADSTGTARFRGGHGGPAPLATIGGGGGASGGDGGMGGNAAANLGGVAICGGANGSAAQLGDDATGSAPGGGGGGTSHAITPGSSGANGRVNLTW